MDKLNIFKPSLTKTVKLSFVLRKPLPVIDSIRPNCPQTTDVKFIINFWIPSCVFLTVLYRFLSL